MCQAFNDTGMPECSCREVGRVLTFAGTHFRPGVLWKRAGGRASRSFNVGRLNWNLNESLLELTSCKAQCSCVAEVSCWLKSTMHSGIWSSMTVYVFTDQRNCLFVLVVAVLALILLLFTSVFTLDFIFSSACGARLVMVLTDCPPPPSPPWLPASGLLVSVWVSSCRLFVDSAGRLRGGGVGVGVKRTADSCYGLRLSFLISSLLLRLLAASPFFTCSWCRPLAVKIPPQW